MGNVDGMVYYIYLLSVIKIHTIPLHKILKIAVKIVMKNS